MNNLNSLIVEGTVEKTEIKETNTSKIAIVFLKTVRSYRNADGFTVEEESTFEVLCYGNMVDYVAKFAKDGRGVRVVGRLKQEKWWDGDDIQRSKIVVICEHIEFKPFKEEK